MNFKKELSTSEPLLYSTHLPILSIHQPVKVCGKSLIHFSLKKIILK